MRTFLLGAVLALASISGCDKDKGKDKASETSTENLPMMSLDEVDKAVTAKEAVAVDCNGERTRKKLGVVPGAILISDEELYPASELPADKQTKLVFYCSDPG